MARPSDAAIEEPVLAATLTGNALGTPGDPAA